MSSRGRYKYQPPPPAVPDLPPAVLDLPPPSLLTPPVTPFFDVSPSPPPPITVKSEPLLRVGACPEGTSPLLSQFPQDSKADIRGADSLQNLTPPALKKLSAIPEPPTPPVIESMSFVMSPANRTSIYHTPPALVSPPISKPSFWLDEHQVQSNTSTPHSPSWTSNPLTLNLGAPTAISASEIRTLLHKHQTITRRQIQLEAAIQTLNTHLKLQAEKGLSNLKHFPLSTTGPLWLEIIDEIVELYRNNGFVVIRYDHPATPSDFLTFKLP